MKGWVLIAAIGLTGAGACHRTSAGPAAPAALPPAPPCPIVPVALVMTAPSGEPRTLLSLDANGSLDVSLIERKPGVAKLDANGCLVGGDGLWAEWAPHGEIWTAHEAFEVAGDCVAMSPTRSLCVGGDGRIEARAANEPAPQDLGSLAIQGYRPGARCAGLLLLTVFQAMMPSMAVVDGHPARAPAPEGSRCGAFRRP